MSPARERRRITLGEIVRTAMSLSTADPDDLGSNSVLLGAGDRPGRVRRAGDPFSPTSTRSQSNRCATPPRRRTCSTTRKSAAISLYNGATFVDEKGGPESKKAPRSVGIYAGRKYAL